MTHLHKEYTRTTCCYKKVGNVELQLDAYQLAGSAGRPAILWIHGGALIFGNRRQLPSDQVEFYLSRGYTVISIDYRLAPEAKLPEIVDDVQCAYRWIQDQADLLKVARDRMAIVGHSAGGYLALLTGALQKPRAIVSFYGYGDITSDWYYRADPHYLQAGSIDPKAAYASIRESVLAGSPITPRNTYYRYCRQNGLWPTSVCGFDPRVETARSEPLCPIRLVSNTYPPTLLIHGKKDTDVPFEESIRMGEELEKHNVPYSIMLLDGRDHLFDIYPEGLPPLGEPIGLAHPEVCGVFSKVGAFLDEHLGAKSQLAQL
ncbi:MAG: alpha/beta hydrolase [Limnochordia bacterium]|jgi:acetyl esterase/lipase